MNTNTTHQNEIVSTRRSLRARLLTLLIGVGLIAATYEFWLMPNAHAQYYRSPFSQQASDQFMQNALKKSAEQTQQIQASAWASVHGETIEVSRRKAEQGDAEAQYKLGLWYETVENNPDESAKWYMKSAEGGNKISQRVIATMYEKGEYFAQNNAKAEEWYLKTGDDFYIGSFYYKIKNYTKAAPYLLRYSKNNENYIIEEDIASMYENGQGLPQSSKLAEQWRDKSLTSEQRLQQINLAWQQIAQTQQRTQQMQNDTIRQIDDNIAANRAEANQVEEESHQRRLQLIREQGAIQRRMPALDASIRQKEMMDNPATYDRQSWNLNNDIIDSANKGANTDARANAQKALEDQKKMLDNPSTYDRARWDANKRTIDQYKSQIQ